MRAVVKKASKSTTTPAHKTDIGKLVFKIIKDQYDSKFYTAILTLPNQLINEYSYIHMWGGGGALKSLYHNPEKMVIAMLFCQIPPLSD